MKSWNFNQIIVCYFAIFLKIWRSLEIWFKSHILLVRKPRPRSRKKLCSLIYCCRTFPHPLQHNSLNFKIFLFFLTILCVRHSNKAWLGDSSTPQSTDWSDHLLFITVHLWATNHLYFFHTQKHLPSPKTCKILTSFLLQAQAEVRILLYK